MKPYEFDQLTTFQREVIKLLEEQARLLKSMIEQLND